MQMVELTAKIADLLIQKIPVISETCAQGISVKFSIKCAGGYQQKSRSAAQTPHQLSLAHDYSVRGQSTMNNEQLIINNAFPRVKTNQMRRYLP